MTRERGTRNAQGEYELGDPVAGPWFPARLMERGAVAPQRRRRQGGTDARVARGYELLAFHTAEDGTPVVLSASSLVETDCPVLGSPTLELDGEPEKLNQGASVIGWMAFAQKVKDAA